MYEPVIEGNYIVTGDTRVIPIMEHKDDEIQWACSTSIHTDAGEPETLKEAMTRPNGHLWKNVCDIRSEQFYDKKGLDSDKENRCKS